MTPAPWLMPKPARVKHRSGRRDTFGSIQFLCGAETVPASVDNPTLQNIAIARLVHTLSNCIHGEIIFDRRLKSSEQG